jgi:hypothetical protein
LSSVSYIFRSFGGVSFTGHPFVSLRQVLQGGVLRNKFPACSSSFASIVRLLAIFREVLPSIGHHLRSTTRSQLFTILVCAQSLRPFQPPLRLTIALFPQQFALFLHRMAFSPSIATDHFLHSCHHTVSTASRCLHIRILLFAAMFKQASSIVCVLSAGLACFRCVMIADAVLIP